MAIVDAELERIYGERKTLLETVVAEQETVLQEELATAKEQHEAAIHKAQEQQQARFEQFWAQCQQEVSKATAWINVNLQRLIISPYIFNYCDLPYCFI